ncbi:BAALC binder of MAP3K1 and KLF4 a isoform X1 [Danio rerio]|uniref:BAALC binder of MAP3K1 and KLF4 a isoform X1 n=1 Tax=Danio rerio TaxID=7955 RepID=A0AC58HHF0_DANRE
MMLSGSMGCGGSRSATIEPRYYESRDTESTWLTNTDTERTAAGNGTGESAGTGTSDNDNTTTAAAGAEGREGRDNEQKLLSEGEAAGERRHTVQQKHHQQPEETLTQRHRG